jgi:hypothetical protein
MGSNQAWFPEDILRGMYLAQMLIGFDPVPEIILGTLMCNAVIGEGLIVAAANPLDLHIYQNVAANPNVTIRTGMGYLEFDPLFQGE